MARAWTSCSDGELLVSASVDADAFGELYRRYEAIVAAFLVRRCRDPELAADLTAETFATALLRADRFRNTGGSAVGWLLAIAKNLLLDAWRRGRAESRARERLGAVRAPVSDTSLERIESMIDAAGASPQLVRALEALPETQRDAVRAYVLDELSYAALAAQLGVPEATVRQRVSRGLGRLRALLEGPVDDRS
jgi:RNA polymerase sigma-70 factor (ECF subfamily)